MVRIELYNTKYNMDVHIQLAIFKHMMKSFSYIQTSTHVNKHKQIRYVFTRTCNLPKVWIVHLLQKAIKLRKKTNNTHDVNCYLYNVIYTQILVIRLAASSQHIAVLSAKIFCKTLSISCYFQHYFFMHSSP